MIATSPVGKTGPAHADEATAVRGAWWIGTAMMSVGVLNYAYALLLIRLLDVGAFATFAAGQGLLLCVSTVAGVAVPWVLAQSLARARSDAERGDAIRFAIVAATAGGLIAGAIVGGIATRFAGLWTTLVLALCTLLIYVTRVAVGWLQGTEHMQTLACADLSEAVLKFAAGLVLVSALGLGDVGALAAFGIAVLPFLIWWPHRIPDGGRRWLTVTADGMLWRKALGAACLQGLVSVMVAVDIVLIAILPDDRSSAASYQAGAMIGRVPLFLASAISISFFPVLSKHRAEPGLAASAVRMYVTVAMPLTVVAATAPGVVLTNAFPSGYTMMGTLLPLTAVSGFALGALSLMVTFSQAVGDYSCLRWQAAGLLCNAAALWIGWRAGGVLGLAIGAACGTTCAMALLLGRLLCQRGTGLLAGIPVLEPVVLGGLLLLLRAAPALWLIAATVTGVRAVTRFFRHQGTPEASGPQAGASRLLIDAVWRNEARHADEDQLRQALVLARRNQVEGLLARAYPEQLTDTLTEVNAETELFRRNLLEVTDRLLAAGMPTVLIKADLTGDYVYGNFDLVVPPGQRRAAETALAGWFTDRSRYWLERSSKVLLEPSSGPAAHLHSAVSWFGVPVIPTQRLFSRAVRDDSLLVPNPADRLRIWLAHGLFQNLTLDLSELLAIRQLLRPDVVAEARREAAREGWAAGCDGALALVAGTIDRLDSGEAVELPVRLPVRTSLPVGAEHACHLLRHGRPSVAVREAALRLPLIVTKLRRKAT
jgi:O-antigen/teichoic acid export membrane protein